MGNQEGITHQGIIKFLNLFNKLKKFITQGDELRYMKLMTTPSSPYKNSIKIFLDGADRSQLLEVNAHPVVSGMTTNPSLMRKAGVQDYKSYCKELLTQITKKPISFEVFADEFNEMERQAHEIRSWGTNVYVKIPITNSRGETAIPLVRKLSESGVQLNVTALFTIPQVLDTCEAVKKGPPSIVSVFAGRIADTGRDPVPLMTASSEICRAYGKQIELLWASSREPLNVVQAELSGCHIITVTNDIIKKLALFNKDLTAMSLDTVKTFKSDSDAARFVL